MKRSEADLLYNSTGHNAMAGHNKSCTLESGFPLISKYKFFFRKEDDNERNSQNTKDYFRKHRDR